MFRKILIVGTTPYSKNTSARAFEAYFSGWERENLAQVFSNPKPPLKGHAEYFYQITDKRLLLRRFFPETKIEKTFRFDELETEEKTRFGERGIFGFLYSIGSRKNPFIYLARKMLWKRKLWQSAEFDKWLEDFGPECVFLSFSDDFFIPEIALYAAEKFDIPIISSIGDDYYFNGKKSLSPLYHIYKFSYRRLIRKVFAHGGSAIFISDKIRDKYNAEFGLSGKTVYLSSELKRKDFSPVNRENPVISYFGNIRQGRNESLSAIGKALGKISPDYKLHIYSAQTERKTTAVFDNNPNVVFHGPIPYSEVAAKTAESDIVVIVEGFREKHIRNTRYSLSTKAADCLASGAQILVFGSAYCGIIEYMKSTESAAVCTDEKELCSAIRCLIDDEVFQRQCYENAKIITEKNHNLKNSNAVFRSVTEDAINGYRKKNGL